LIGEKKNACEQTHKALTLKKGRSLCLALTKRLAAEGEDIAFSIQRKELKEGQRDDQEELGGQKPPHLSSIEGRSYLLPRALLTPLVRKSKWGPWKKGIGLKGCPWGID